MIIKESSQRGSSEERNARRKKAAVQAAPREPDNAALRALTDKMPEVARRMGVLGLLDGDREIEVVVDPDVIATAETYVRALAGETEGAAAVQPALGRLREVLPRWRALQGALGAAQQLDSDLADTDRWAGREEQVMQAELFLVLDGLLDGSIGSLTQPQRDRLRAKAQRLFDLRQAENEVRQKERTLTQAAQAEASRTLSQAAAEAQMRKVALDLQQDRPVGDDDLDAALATFATLTERRGSAR